MRSSGGSAEPILPSRKAVTGRQWERWWTSAGPRRGPTSASRWPGWPARIRAFDDARLGDRVGQQRDPALGTGSTYYVMLHGAVQHNLYHAGQIALLRKFT